MSRKSEIISLAVLITSASLLCFSLLIMICQVTCDKDNAKDGAWSHIAIILISRICFLVELPIMYYRINSSWKVNKANLEMIN